MKSFKKFNEEAIKECVVTIGRFQPPHKGHEISLDFVAKRAKSSSFLIYTTQSNDTKENPLPYKKKVKWLRKMFPRYARNIVEDDDIFSLLHVARDVYTKGYTKLVFVVGADRIASTKSALLKYNGVEGRKRFYIFPDGIEVISSGGRSTVSGTNMRKLAADNKLLEFSKDLPKGFKQAKELMNDVRKGMGLEESHYFRQHTKLDTKSDIRERFVRGEIFNTGDLVETTNGSKRFTIIYRGPNFVGDSQNNRHLIHNIRKI